MFSIREELADHLCPAMFLFVQVDFGAFHTEDAEIGMMPVDASLRQNMIPEVRMERIACGKMTHVFSWHKHPCQPVLMQRDEAARIQRLSIPVCNVIVIQL